MRDSQSGMSDSAGAMLHAERRRQSFSVGDVSRHLKLSVRQVEALERDEYKSFGGPVFVHGFLRNYAKLLGLDPSQLIQAADRKLAEQRPPPAVKQHSEVAPQSVTIGDSPQKSIAPVILVAAILIAAILGWTYLREEEPPPESVPVAEMSEQLVADTASEAETILMTEPGAEIGPDTPETRVTPESAAPRAQIADGVVVLVFRQESWVEITDRYGVVIYTELAPQGVSRQVRGKPPMSVVIGNATGVDLIYNDKSIDLGPHTRVDVARVNLE